MCLYQIFMPKWGVYSVSEALRWQEKLQRWFGRKQLWYLIFVNVYLLKKEHTYDSNAKLN